MPRRTSVEHAPGLKSCCRPRGARLLRLFTARCRRRAQPAGLPTSGPVVRDGAALRGPGASSGGFGRGLRRALGEPDAIFQDVDLAADGRVCSGSACSSDLGRSASDVANDSAIFDAWRSRASSASMRSFSRPGRGASEPGHFRARFRRHRYRSDARASRHPAMRRRPRVETER